MRMPRAIKLALRSAVIASVALWCALAALSCRTAWTEDKLVWFRHPDASDGGSISCGDDYLASTGGRISLWLTFRSPGHDNLAPGVMPRRDFHWFSAYAVNDPGMGYADAFPEMSSHWPPGIVVMKWRLQDLHVTHFYVSVPLLVIWACLSAAPARWLIVRINRLNARLSAGIRLRQRPDNRWCRNCGYDLTGNVSGKCPECGTVIVNRIRG